jgi:hypothetical protein
MRRKIALLTAAALIGLIPIGAATAAQASGHECAYNEPGNDNAETNMCIWVNGTGLHVNSVEDEISDGGSYPATDIWWPTVTGCTVQPGWIAYNKSGDGTTYWLNPKACSTFKSSGGYVFGENLNVPAGEVCGYWYFVQYVQEFGTGCVGTHA